MTSVMAARAAAWSTMFLPVAQVAMSAAGRFVDLGDRVVGEEFAGEPCYLQVVADVAAGLFGRHAGYLVADGDALVEGGQDAELDHAPQGGLAGQDGGDRGAAVHVVVGQHSD